MTYHQELQAWIRKLNQLTGISLDIHADSPEEAVLAIEQLNRLYNAYKDKYDKNHFLQNLLQNKLSENDLLEGARHFHIKPDESRVLFLLETKGKMDDSTVLLFKQIYPTKTGVYLLPISETRLAILKPISPKDYRDEYLKEIGIDMIRTLNAELYMDGWITCSPHISHLSELTAAFQKTTLAAKLGRTFYSQQQIFFSEKLGLGGLLYQLPETARKNFLYEVFRTEQPSITSDMIELANRFFENNLNVSETARQLYMHRNTLFYRLDAIQQMTGLNLRNFDDAITFKIALMLLNYNN